MNNTTDNLLLELHQLEKKLLSHLTGLKISAQELEQTSSLSYDQVTKGLRLLQEHSLVELTKDTLVFFCLTEQGTTYLETGLPEVQLYNALKNAPSPITHEQLLNLITLEPKEVGFALGYLKKSGILTTEKKENVTYYILTNIQPSFADLTLFHHGIEEHKLTDIERQLIKRKELITTTKIITYTASLTSQGEKAKHLLASSSTSENIIDQINPDLFKLNDFSTVTFKPYSLTTTAQYPKHGRKHPLHEASAIVRDIFVGLGFQEMKGPHIESAFWNMDVLWIPQDHPARDVQDTFYLDGHETLDKELVKKVKHMHEHGITISHTDPGHWKQLIASKQLLRTHSTPTSFRVLHKLAQQYQGDIPHKRYFYIAKVFRNEAIDATHLAEFHQAEGFIIGDNLGLAHLMGFIKEFYAQLGITQIRFKPTFNPYTEPSMEAHYYDPKMKKWYALINSGIFRPETLAPLGINKTIIAWGMGLNRIAGLLAQTEAAKELVGADINFTWLQERQQLKRLIVR